MNERIKELAEQAGVFEGVFTKHGGVPCDLKGYGMLEAEMAKFAELIVGECTDVALKQKKQVEEQETFNQYDYDWNRARIQQSQHIADKIKQHFRVEE